jgi:hypothetical protein
MLSNKYIKNKTIKIWGATGAIETTGETTETVGEATETTRGSFETLPSPISVVYCCPKYRTPSTMLVNSLPALGGAFPNNPCSNLAERPTCD